MKVTLKFDNFKTIFEATERKKWDLYKQYPYYKSDIYNHIEVHFPNFIEKCKYWFWRFRFLHEEKKRKKVQNELNSLEIFKNDIGKLKEKREEAIQKDLEEVKEIMNTPVPTSIELTLENLEEKYKAEDKKEKGKDKARPISIHDIVNQNFEDKLRLLSTYGVKSDEFAEMINALQTKEDKYYPFRSSGRAVLSIVDVIHFFLSTAKGNLDERTTGGGLNDILYTAKIYFMIKHNIILFDEEVNWKSSFYTASFISGANDYGLYWDNVLFNREHRTKIYGNYVANGNIPEFIAKELLYIWNKFDGYWHYYHRNKLMWLTHFRTALSVVDNIDETAVRNYYFTSDDAKRFMDFFDSDKFTFDPNIKEPEAYKGTTYPAIEVLNYMLEYAWENEGKESKNGLQYLYQATKLYHIEKVLYLMQLVYINRYNKPLFFDNIEVTSIGPTIPSLRHYQITSSLYNRPKKVYRYYEDVDNFWNYREDEILDLLNEEDKAFVREWWGDALCEEALNLTKLSNIVDTHDIIKDGRIYFKMFAKPKKLTVDMIRQEGKEIVEHNKKEKL